MLYSEFLELTKISRELVGLDYYTKCIEPIYMDCNEKITKDIFCEQWKQLTSYYARYELPVLAEVADTKEFLSYLDTKVLGATRRSTKELREMLIKEVINETRSI
jgi:hypothetical protein